MRAIAVTTIFDGLSENGSYCSETHVYVSLLWAQCRYRRYNGRLQDKKMAKRKVSLRSLQNLTHHGRPTDHDEKKTTHNISVTPTAWKGVHDVASSLGYPSVSEFIEQVGRRQIYVEQKQEQESIKEQNSQQFQIQKFRRSQLQAR